MRILITSDYIDIDNIGGAGRVLWELAGELLRRGYEVSFLVGGPQAQHREVEHPAGSIEWLSFPYRTSGPRGLRFLGEVRSAVRGGITQLHPPDLIIHNQPLSADALRQLDVPSIYLFHSPWPNEFVADRFGDDQLPRGLSRGVKTRVHVDLRRRIERRAVVAADASITLSRHMHDRLLSLYPVDPATVTICPGGVDLDRFSPVDDDRRRSIRESWGVADGEFVMACVRRLVPRTGVDLLIDALGRLADDPELPPWRVAIAGRGPLAAGIRAKAQRRHIDGRLSLLGYIPDDELADLYRGADVAVVPTRALEGFGLSTLESLACGTPVVATPVGGSVEILERLEPSFLCSKPTAEALAARLKHWMVRPRQMHEWRSRSREFVFENYSWERMAEGVVGVIERVAEPLIVP